MPGGAPSCRDKEEDDEGESWRSGKLSLTSEKSLRVAFIFPANLGGARATPIRARVTIQAVRERFQTHALALGGDPAWVEVLSVGQQGADGQPPKFRFWRFTQEALPWLEALAPQVIHAVTTVAAVPALLYKRRHPHTRLVFEMHGVTLLELREAWWHKRLIYGLLDYLGARQSDAIVAMSYTQRDFLCRWFRVGTDKIHVLWGPVDLELFRYEDPPPAPPFFVGYSGNDRFWQGFETILEACRLLQQYADIHFLLMGFPPERYLGLGFPNVTFAGVLSRQEVPAHLSRCHILLSPRAGGSVTETQYPFKLSAYLALGRPVIASTVSDQPMILKQADCGLVVPPGDARALAEAILQLWQMPQIRRLELGRNARLFAERHLSLERLADALSEIYN